MKLLPPRLNVISGRESILLQSTSYCNQDGKEITTDKQTDRNWKPKSGQPSRQTKMRHTSRQTDRRTDRQVDRQSSQFVKYIKRLCTSPSASGVAPMNPCSFVTSSVGPASNEVPVSATAWHGLVQNDPFPITSILHNQDTFAFNQQRYSTNSVSWFLYTKNITPIASTD